ncbi:DUF6266 family protein [Pedobacter ginsengisoli]|uniref:DUF6266 family protein n=1 Tax=Pedobacter ginsengisoli TaxID=363852 RepID=UPI00254F0BA1|nr:DUF6266 family protein [Pedobacter ginsengisoli]
MARFNNGINGAFSGKIGTVIGAECRGVQYGRSIGKPNTKGPTLAQQEQRNRFALVFNWLKPLLDVITTGFGLLTGKSTPMNNAVSYHLKEAVTRTGGEMTIDYKKAIFSRGELLASWILEVLTLAEGLLSLRWKEQEETLFCGKSDKASFVAYNPAKTKFIKFKDAAIRGDGEVMLQMPPDFSGDDLHCWMSYASETGNRVSTTIYIGKVRMA